MRRTEDKPYWSKTYSVGAVSVYAWERLERDGHIFVKYPDRTRAGRDTRVKAKLPGDLSIRDQKGRIDKKRVREVDEAVQLLAARLLLGGPEGSTPVPARALTLADGFAKALDISSGKYPAKTRRWEEVKRAQSKLERILGAATPWVAISPGQVRAVWRTLAREYREADGRQGSCGARQTEVTIDALYSVATWLREEHELPSDAVLPMTKWRAKLKAEWAQITGRGVTPSRPRHSADEMRRLFARLNDPRVDRRFALAFDLGGEQRLGQVLRCMRSDLKLPVVDPARRESLVPGQLGVLRVPSAGHKHAVPIYLTQEQRDAVETALAGYLSEYETDWRTGRMADYPLFPAGRLRSGKARVRSEPQPLTRDAALKMFRELESVAGVKPVKGRGWYGVRRVAADVAEDLEKDERVLNSITGHRDSTTRRLVYQDGQRPEVLRQAALTRTKVRRETADDVETGLTAGGPESALA